MLKHPNLKHIKNIEANNFDAFMEELSCILSARVFVRTLNVQALGTWRVYGSDNANIMPYIAMRTVGDCFNVYEIVGIHPSELKL